MMSVMFVNSVSLTNLKILTVYLVPLPLRDPFQVDCDRHNEAYQETLNFRQMYTGGGRLGSALPNTALLNNSACCITKAVHLRRLLQGN